MRKKILGIILSLVCIICIAFGVTACGNSSSSTSTGSEQSSTTDSSTTDSSASDGSSASSTTKQVPVYQGMVISSAETTSTTSAKAASAKLTGDKLAGSPYYDDYGNYYDGNGGYYDVYGQYHDGEYHPYHGDYNGKDSDIDYDQPYDDDTPTIEQEIETTLKVTGTGQDIYYADKGDDIYITIKLYNPDYFDIISFVLSYGSSEIHYSSYMFESGSDYDNIIIKLNVGTTGGIIEYAISEIKYIDTDVKNVLMDGDTVVKCGVRADDQTYASVSNETHDLDSISFDVKIFDLYDLIEYSGGYAMAVLYDGDSLIQTVDLVVGANTIEFNDLTPNTLYQYAVVALFDDLSGVGTALNYLYKNAVYTDTIVLFDNITVGQEDISFGYSWYEGYSAATITQLTLTHNGKTQDLDSTAAQVTNLLSNNEYVLTAYYTNLSGETESIALTFTTTAKAAPTVEISALDSTQTAVTYDLTITDTDSVGSLTSVTLSLGSTGITLTSTAGTFTGLLSDNTYTLTVIYTYDLNDGTGSHTVEVAQDITTQAKAAPAVDIPSLTSGQESISYALVISDIDNVGSIKSVTLTLGETTVETSTASTGTFTGLLSNNTYTLTVVYTYDLNDGVGEQTKTVTKNITTQAKNVPTVDICDLTSTQESIDYTLSINDPDSVGALTSATLSHGSTEIALTSESGTFSNLLSDNTYTLTIIYTYDLNDGTGSHTVEVAQDIKTEAKAAPTVAISTLTSEQESVSYELTITDTDVVGSLTSVTLTLGDTGIALTSAAGTFTNLLSDNTYTLAAVYTYDLNDGVGEQTKIVTKSITTKAKAAPAVAISTLTSEQESVNYELTITDTDAVGSLTSVTLTLGETTVETSTASTGTFTGLLSNNTYTLTVVYTYDLNDGADSHTVEVAQDITTQAKAAPEIDIEFADNDTTSVTFNITFTDDDNVGSITAIGLYNGTTLVEEVADVTQTTFTFTGLDSEIQYTLKVNYKYNLNDGIGDIEAYETFSTYTSFVVGFDSFSVLNTSAVSEGETIVVQADMYNPGNVTFTAIVVNGETYTVSSVSTYKKIRAEIVYNGQFEGGNTAITVSQLICTLNGKTYTVDISSNNTAYVFINGELTVDDISVVHLVDGQFEETYYSFYSEQLYYQITLTNATCYDVYSVTIGGTTYDSGDITMSDDYQTAYVAISYNWSGWQENTLSSISYSNSTFDKTKPIDMSAAYMRLSSDDIVEITSAEQLLDVDDYKYYKLMNDIDLSGYEWANMGNYMRGIFDGNGYSVKNMSAVTTYTDTGLKLGLFHYVEGIVTNLNITDALYMITVNNSTGNSYSIYAGGIAAHAGNVTIDNCNVEFSIQLTNNNTDGEVRIGGIIGEISASYVTIKDVNVEAVISVTSKSNSSLYAGGIAGYMDCWQKASVSSLEVDLTAAISISNGWYSAGAYFGYSYCSNSTLVIKDSTANYTLGNNVYAYFGIDGFNFTCTNGAYTLTDYYGSDTDIVLPESVFGSTYSIASDAFNNTTVKSITITKGVKAISSSAFSNCSAKIIWADDIILTEIGSGAFANYKGASLTIPNSVTTLSSYAFQGCTAEIIWSDGFTITEIGEYVFAGYNGSSLTIPNSVTSLGSYAFQDCTAEIIWSENIALKTISNWVFAWYAGTSITIPDSVTTISDWAFGYCTSLTSIYLGSGLTSIEYYAFYECSALANIYITDIADWCQISFGNPEANPLSNGCNLYLNGELVTELVIPDSVTSIGNYAFYNYTALTSITIGSGLTSIGNYAFYNCSALTSIYITDIADWCQISFDNAGANPLSNGCNLYLNGELVTELVIPDSVTSIGSYAFYNYTALNAIYIPKTVTTIKNNAFGNCSYLVVVEVESRPDTWSTEWDSNNSTVLWGFTEIPSQEATYTFVTNGGSEVESITAAYLTSLPSTTRDGYAFAGWYEDADFTVKVTAPYYSSADVTLYAKWYDLSGLTQSEGLEIENGVIVGIGTCTDTVLMICMPIADSAFYGCSQITAIYLYDGCTSVGYQAFDYCNNLKEVYFYQSEMPDIGQDVFANTWDSSDFAIYVLSDLYSEYQNVSDTYWQNSIVSAGKLYTI